MLFQTCRIFILDPKTGKMWAVILSTSIKKYIFDVNSCQCQNTSECSLFHPWKCFSDAMGYKSYDVYFVLGFYFLKSLFTKAAIWISLSAISPLSFPKVLRSWIIPTPHWPVVKLTETAYLGRGLQQLFWPLSKESVFISHSPSNTL